MREDPGTRSISAQKPEKLEGNSDFARGQAKCQRSRESGLQVRADRPVEAGGRQERPVVHTERELERRVFPPGPQDVLTRRAATDLLPVDMEPVLGRCDRDWKREGIRHRQDRASFAVFDGKRGELERGKLYEMRKCLALSDDGDVAPTH